MSFKVDIPSTAKGEVVSGGISYHLTMEEKKRQERRPDRRHDWMIAAFGCLGGAVFGFLSSYVFG